MFISPHYTNTDFSSPLSIDQKIDLFEDRIIGWKINIADLLINGGVDLANVKHEKGIQGAGFAVLDILFSYFEMIGKLANGYSEANRSKEFFKKGFSLTVGVIEDELTEPQKESINLLYEECRNSLYHSGLTGPNITLTSEIYEAIKFFPSDGKMVINPHKFPIFLRDRFFFIIKILRNPENGELRTNFERYFDRDNKKVK